MQVVYILIDLSISNMIGRAMSTVDDRLIECCQIMIDRLTPMLDDGFMHSLFDTLTDRFIDLYSN